MTDKNICLKVLIQRAANKWSEQNKLNLSETMQCTVWNVMYEFISSKTQPYTSQ